MQVVVDIPERLAGQLLPEGEDPARTMLEDRIAQAYREGRLGGCQVDGFVPARIVSEVQSTTERAAPATGTLEVVTANGRRVIVDRNVDVAVLLRIMRGLETLR